jgi:deferrochelatase/peroxidase EfeB
MREELAHQIVRRGMTYGPHDPGDPGAPAEDHGSGLLFMCFQSSIEAQFEHIFKNWVNDPAFSRSRTGRDALIGQGPSEMQQWPRKDGNFVPFAFERCVTLKGGEYFFAPLKSALAAQS